jgi:hypothetical protein
VKARLVVLVALVAMIPLTSVATAGSHAAKQRVAITVTILPSGNGVLTPLGKGALARDAGTFGGSNLESRRQSGRHVLRDGQQVDIYTGVVWTLTGKRGNLVLRERAEWTDLGQDLNRDGVGFRYGSGADGIATGTWKLVRGTGAYAGVSGGGRSSHLGQGRRWVARYEGFLIAS